MFQRFRGLSAFVALLALIGGVPVALVRFVGRPWSAAMPAPAVVWRALRAGDISDRAVIGFLAIVVWITWARLTISIGVDIVARLRGVHVPRIVGLGSAQRWAAVLVATAVLLVGGVSRPVFAARSDPVLRPIATAVLHLDAPLWSSTNQHDGLGWADETPATLPPSASATSDRVADGPMRTHVVLRHESFWSIAEDALGDGSRWSEIVEINAGREVAPGIAFDGTANRLQPGWELLVPGESDAACRRRPRRRLWPVPTRCSLLQATHSAGSLPRSWVTPGRGRRSGS